MRTYISLFSSAGIGCYGFKMEGFECVATNELIERRLNIQKSNSKCKYDSGYICGDITSAEVKSKLYAQIDFWKNKENMKKVDVVIATPPCQGMSVANHKKTDEEIIRNSLVIESIKIIKEIHPSFFVFENVPAFMRTMCTDVDKKDKPIAEAIENNLGGDYSYVARIINFKNYGASSSRSRTVVIGVSNEYADEVSPYELYPIIKPEKTLKDVIGSLKRLTQFGEIDSADIYHAFRTYPEHMREWIKGIKEGESAFENKDDKKKPHRVIDGKIVINKQKNGDKYRRQFWDKVGPCVHTRNDQLASQNTIHPEDDRVFSIRELMHMMTVPDTFKWSDADINLLNKASDKEKRAYLKKEEIKIRQSLGEAVPTVIFQEIAQNICEILKKKPLSIAEVKKIVDEYKLNDVEHTLKFIDENPLNMSYTALCCVAELSNTARTDNAAYYTNKSLITEMVKNLPDVDGRDISVLEPSAGVGSFVPIIARRFEGKNISIDLFDIDKKSKIIAERLMKLYGAEKYCTINYINDDFLLHDFDKRYDFVIGNPPFYKMRGKNKLLKTYREMAVNKTTSNICSFFLDKALTIADYVSLVLPKFILNTPEFVATREHLSNKSVECIIDFGEKGFKGVLIETIALFVNNHGKVNNTIVFNHTLKKRLKQKQKYIFDKNLPYWIIYRNNEFDKVHSKLNCGIFEVFRDRQITNAILKESGGIRILKSRNISDNGQSIVNIDGYDSYIDEEKAKSLSIYKFLNRDDVYITPNMTYYPRVMRKPKNILMNGSVAILIPKTKLNLTKKQLLYFSSDEYRAFYKIARNYQTRSLNVDACSVYFYGILKK